MFAKAKSKHGRRVRTLQGQIEAHKALPEKQVLELEHKTWMRIAQIFEEFDPQNTALNDAASFLTSGVNPHNTSTPMQAKVAFRLTIHFMYM